MKKIITSIMLMVCAMILCACSDNSASLPKYGLEKLPEATFEFIGNTIPEWVENTQWAKALYTVSSSDMEVFDEYVLEVFPAFSDSSWTQEQSDSVYLGKGIKQFVLDNSKEINSSIYYPVILNGVIVSGCQVSLNNDEIAMKLSPALANQLNLIMDLTSEDNPLILGYNNNNTIAIIGNACFVLEEDRMLHSQVDLDLIPNIEINSKANALDAFCTERTANVKDWIMSNR